MRRRAWLLAAAFVLVASVPQAVGAQIAAPSPSPAPTPSPAPALREILLQGGYTLAKVYNPYADGVTGTGFSYVASGAYRFGPWAIKADERTDFFRPIPNVPGPPPGVGFSTPDGGYSVVPPFTGRISDADVRAERTIFGTNSYAGISYVSTSTSYGYPTLRGAGFGLEQYPDFTPFAVYGSVFYYPSVGGTFVQTDPHSSDLGQSFPVRFSQLKYTVESALPIDDALYAFFGYGGYRMLSGFTSNENVEGPYVGLGTRLDRSGAAADEPRTTHVVQTNAADPGYIEGALRFGGENAVGTQLPSPDTSGSFQVDTAYRSGPWAVTFDFHRDSYQSSDQTLSAIAPLREQASMAELRGLISVTRHNLYLGVGLLNKSGDTSPASQTGPGLGFAKLPDLAAHFSGFGSVFYYVAGSSSRRYLVYDYGLTYRAFRQTFFYGGFWGYHGEPPQATIDETHFAPYLGLGVRL